MDGLARRLLGWRSAPLAAALALGGVAAWAGQPWLWAPAVLLGALTVAAFLAFPDIALPAPTGPWAVGVLAADAAGTPVRLWYPAAPGLADRPYRYLAGLTGPVFGAPALLYRHLKGRRTAALNAPAMAVADEPWPVVLYLHGADSFAEENSLRLIALASRGFVVAAVSHPTPYAAYDIPTALAANPEAFGRALAERVLPDRVADLARAVAWLERETRLGGRFAGRLALARYGALGFSLGGAVAAEHALTDRRCVALFNLDSSGFGAARAGVDAACFQLSQALIAPGRPAHTTLERIVAHYVAEVADLLDGAARRGHATWWFRLEQSGHVSFTDLALWTPLRLGPLAMFLGSGAADPLRRTIDDLVLAFFGELLRGEPGVDAAVARQAARLTRIRPPEG